MKKTLIILGAMAITLLFYWYFSSENAFTLPPRPSIDQPLTLKMDRLEQKFGACPSPDVQCLHIKMEYPVVKTGNKAALETINNHIKEILLQSVTLGEEPYSLDTPIDSALHDLEEDYNDFLEELPDVGFAWSIENIGKVDFQNDSTLTLSFSEYTFTGGAHPNNYVQIVNFDTRNGNLLALADLVKDTVALKQMAEPLFRKSREIPAGDSLNQAGFWFPDNEFCLPQNYGLDPAGLRLYFNAYEIGPYVLGPTEILIPKNLIKALMNR